MRLQKTRTAANKLESSGDYRVEVRFSTAEVRKYSDRFRTEERFKIV
jgi:hypothetical protein